MSDSRFVADTESPDDPDTPSPPFWWTVALADMTPAQWEALCDGCGRCCLVKLQDMDDGRYYHTDIACRYLDPDTCRCRDYAARQTLAEDCVVLTPQSLESLGWLPESCAYRLLHEKRSLPEWHPLVSGRADSVFEAGVAVANRVVSEDEVTEEELYKHIVRWSR